VTSKNFNFVQKGTYLRINNNLEAMVVISCFAPEFIAKGRFRPQQTGPDAAPSWAFRNLWLETAASDTDLARALV
jgi:hypothetical protein